MAVHHVQPVRGMPERSIPSEMVVVRALLLLLATSSCKREDSVPVRATAISTKTSQPEVLEPSRDISPIVERLAWEAQNRPQGGGIRAEEAFDALERAGLVVGGRRQYLGITMRASYCAGGTTADGVAVSICEYPSKQAADAGKTFVDAQFSAMTPRARRVVHRHALLTVSVPPHGKSHVEASVVRTFMNL